MKQIFSFCFLLIFSFSFSQDLESVLVSDQFTNGFRGNAYGSLTYGASKLDGTEYLDQTSVPNETTGTIRYINGYAGASVGDPTYGESPVITCTAAYTNPDRGLINSIPAIPANTRPGAASPEQCILIGDDGGFNGIFFGESNDANYYIEIDAYCFDRASLGGSCYENIMVSARAARDNDPNMTEYSFNIDKAGSYCLLYDSFLRKIIALKWTIGNSSTIITYREPSAYTAFGEVKNVTTGWHTFRIECYNSNIRYYVDGNKIADVIDTTFSNGRPGFGYREYNISNIDEYQGHFDNLKAGMLESGDYYVLY